jgi:peptidoglycan/LPS O-acetylase OafA/YrhL
LTARAVAFLGLVSYGIYLWHQIVIDVLIDATAWKVFRAPFSLLAPTVALLTVALAAVSYRLVEQPSIALGRRTREPTQQRRERLAGLDRR